MEIRILYFAHVRARVGLSSELLAMPEGASVADAVEVLKERYPTLQELLPVVRLALNGEFSQADAKLAQGDELVLIPPVAGGAGVPAVAISDSPLTNALLEVLKARVGGAGFGAVVTFEGVVRDHARGHDVVALEYEAYRPMALRQLQRILEAAEDDFSPLRAVIHHRVGALEVGDVAVVVVTASPHRREAFLACQQIIDQLKQDVPIWKRETSLDGAEWVSDRP